MSVLCLFISAVRFILSFPPIVSPFRYCHLHLLHKRLSQKDLAMSHSANDLFIPSSFQAQHQLYVYSQRYSRDDDLKNGLSGFQCEYGSQLAMARQWLLNKSRPLLLVDMRFTPQKMLADVRYLLEHFTDAILVCMVARGQQQWGKEALKLGVHAYTSFEDCSAAGLQMLFESLLSRTMLSRTMPHHHDKNIEGLITQAMYFDRLNHALEVAARHKKRTGILVLQIDNYEALAKKYNAAFNESFYSEISHRLKTCLRISDSLASTDEAGFLILLEDLADESMIMHIAQKIQKQLSLAFKIHKKSLNISLSIGAHLCDSGESNGQALYRQAHIALERAQEQGNNTLWFYRQALNLKSMARTNMQQGLQRALDQNEFCLVYLPSHGAKGFILNGIEPCLRWQHPNAGMVYPDVFMALLESSGLIVEVGKWWVETAFMQYKAWLNSGCIKPYQKLFLSMSEKQFRHNEFVNMLKSQLAEHAIKAEQLVLSIEEKYIRNNTALLNKISSALPGIGLAIKLGNFTDGYSSLSYLKKIDVDYICLKSDVFQHLHLDHLDSSMVKIMIDMAHTLGIEVLASGADNAFKLNKMQALGCDCLQGDYFSEPLPAKRVQDYVFNRASKSVIQR